MDSLEIDDIICPKIKCDSLYQVIDKYCVKYKTYRYIILNLSNKELQYMTTDTCVFDQWIVVGKGKSIIDNIMKF